MSIKVIAIGSRLMGDDGVAIAAVEQLSEELAAVDDIFTIIGETDVEYCLDYINDSDSIIILDAAISSKPWGTVWQLPLAEAIDNVNEKSYQHDADLLSALKRKRNKPSGLLICIEAAEVTQKLGLSEALETELPTICNKIKKIILEYRGDLQHA